MISQKSPVKGGTPNSFQSFNLNLKGSERDSQFNWFHVLPGRAYVCVCVGVCVGSVMSNSCDSMVCSPPGSSVHGIFSRQEYWSGLPFPPPRDLPDTGIETEFPGSAALAGRLLTTEPAGQGLPTGARTAGAVGRIAEGRCFLGEGSKRKAWGLKGGDWKGWEKWSRTFRETCLLAERVKVKETFLSSLTTNRIFDWGHSFPKVLGITCLGRENIKSDSDSRVLTTVTWKQDLTGFHAAQEKPQGTGQEN